MRYPGSIACLLAAALGMFPVSQCQADVFIEHLSPPVLTRGTNCRLQMSGTMLDQPVGLWTSVRSPGSGASAAGGPLNAKPVGTPTNGTLVLEVEVPADAPLGVYGLRLATRSGLSNVHLFLIDELPVTEQSSLAANPQGHLQTGLPVCVTSICRAAQVDRYAIEVSAGQRVAFEVIGNRFGKDYDPLVTIRSHDGRLLAEHDNDPGLMFDCRFDHLFEQAGRYVVEVRDSRFSGDDTWRYALRMGDFPAVRVAVPSAVRPGHKSTFTFPERPDLRLELDLPATLASGTFFQEVRGGSGSRATWIPLLVSAGENAVEVAPNQTRETATPVTVPANLHGVLATPGEQDWFAFPLLKGQSLHVAGVANALGSPADLEILMYDATGRELRRIDDVGLEEGAFDFNPGQDGQYFLMVRDMARDGGPAFAYRIEVQQTPARLELASDVSALTVPQQSYQPIPITVTRTGFSGPVELSLIGAPPGVTLDPLTIPEDAKEFVCRLTATDAAAPGVATVQIIGRAKANDLPLEAVVQTHPLVDRQLHNVDLIIYALREEQRHLPPSLIDCFAVQVIPPIPYTLEFPEQVVVLPRYQSVTFPAVMTRAGGFDAPVTFEASGGQIGLESELRRQIFGRFPQALAGQLNVPLKMLTRNLVQLAKTRVDMTATAAHGGRTIQLHRTFTLDVKSAFEPSIEPRQAVVMPGETVNIRLLANRLPTFDGDVTAVPLRANGFVLPETVVIPKGMPEVMLEIKVAADARPGKHRLRFPVSGFVGVFEESLNGPEIEIEIKPAPAETKK